MNSRHGFTQGKSCLTTVISIYNKMILEGLLRLSRNSFKDRLINYYLDKNTMR